MISSLEKYYKQIQSFFQLCLIVQTIFLSLLISSLTQASLLQPDVWFEVEKVSYNKLRLSTYEGYRRVFNESVTLSSTPVCVENKRCLVQSLDDHLIWRYQGQDHSYLTLALNKEGDITLMTDTTGKGTHYDQHKSWGFRTEGKFINKASSAFYKLEVKASQIHNFSILKSYQADFKSAYYFNKGVMHFGDEQPVAVAQNYLEYLLRIDHEAKPTREPLFDFEKNIIDDYGVILAEKGLTIRGLEHRIHGLVDVDALDLDEAKLDVQNELIVRDQMTGHTPKIKIQPQGVMQVGVIPPHVHIQDWHNQGRVFVHQSATLHIQGILDNTFIHSAGPVVLRSAKKPKAVGVVACEGDLKFIIDEIISDETRKAVLKGACLLSGQNKVTLKMVHHTDHYLNTITNHYTRDQWGREQFSHKTETGYQFQRRTTEKSARTVDHEMGDDPLNALKGQNQVALDRSKLMDDIKRAIKSRLKGMTSLAQRSSDLGQSLLALLQDLGFTLSEVEDLFEDDLTQTLIAAFALPPEHRKDFATKVGLDTLQPYLDLLKAADPWGWSRDAYHWVKNNPDALLEAVCLSARVGAFNSIPYVGVPVNTGVNTFCLGAKVYKGGPKVQVHLNAKHGDKAPNILGTQTGSRSTANTPQRQIKTNDSLPRERSNQAETKPSGSLTNVPQRIQNVTKAESPIWKNLQPYRGDIKTNGLSGKKQRFYKWDHLHNEIEMYGSNGKPMAALDPVTGKALEKSVVHHKDLKL